MYVYDTVSEALDKLKSRGYEYDFNLKGARLTCDQLNREWEKDKLSIDEVHRFEGDSDPADEAIVFAITTEDGTLGTFVDAYGTYYDEEGLSLIKSLRQKLYP